MTEYTGPVDGETVEDAIDDIEDVLDRDSWVDISGARPLLREARDLLDEALDEDGADPETVRRAFDPLERAARVFHRSPQISLAYRVRDINEDLGDAHAEVIDWDASR